MGLGVLRGDFPKRPGPGPAIKGLDRSCLFAITIRPQPQDSTYDWMRIGPWVRNVNAEMALAVLAYNLTRVMNIIGIEPLIAAIKEILRSKSRYRDHMAPRVTLPASWNQELRKLRNASLSDGALVARMVRITFRNSQDSYRKLRCRYKVLWLGRPRRPSRNCCITATDGNGITSPPKRKFTNTYVSSLLSEPCLPLSFA